MYTIECPRCGYNRASTANTTGIRPSTTPGSVGETDESSLLEDEIRCLGSEIFGLNEARAALLHRLNNLRSVMRYVPPEVLSTIFQFVITPVDFMQSLSSEGEAYNSDELFQCKMTAVSHSWRQAALSNPRFAFTEGSSIYYQRQPLVI